VSSRIRALYAEDDPLDADLTTAWLREAAPDISIEVVRTGEACLIRLQERRHDVVLLDNHLPDMDGVDVLKQLTVRRIDVPVVVTTGVGDESLAVHVLRLGASDYLPKAGNYLERLPETLRSAVAGYQLLQKQRGARGSAFRRIVYAEHVAADADLTRRHIAEAAPHLHLEVVDTSGAALDRASGGKADLVLIDLRMPDMSALEFMREARYRQVSVPVIVITGRGDETAAAAALKLGAYDYIVKRDGYLEQLPYAVDHAIARFELSQLNRRLEAELDERGRLQQTAAESLALLDAVQKHAPIGIAFMDRDCRVQRANDEFAAIAGVAVERLIGRTAAEILPEVWTSLAPLCARASAGEPVHGVPISVPMAPGASAGRHFIGTLYPVPLRGDVAGIGIALVEITEQKHAEDMMREHALALSEAARQKDEFLAMLGHELRNPLAPIRTALELLRREEPPDGMAANAHDVMERQIAHMVRLLDDLLDVARITSGRINLDMRTLDLHQVVADALESVRGLVQARRHRLETSMPREPLLVRGDATRLVQVLVNLLNNAAKYTAEGGTIRVAMTAEDGRAVLRVADTGVGISPRLLPKIFDLFTQDERALDRAEGGLGLGLTLVRRITELHGGTVRASSAGRGHGSEFVVSLPVWMDDVVAAGRASEVPAAPRRRCLVVEDNVDAARMLECALALEGHEVRLAFDGRDALEAAKEFAPDAVVLDIGLPRMNGYEAARAIRQLPGLADVLIVALTGYGQAADYEKSRAAGFDAHLVKPVELDALLRALAGGRASAREASGPPRLPT
jgi:PAS domain S-box-containing protein